MTHDEVVLELPDLVAGRLAESRRAAVTSHVEGCAECRELVDAYGAMARALEVDRESPDHVPVADVVDAALGRRELAKDLARHLEQCSLCAAEVARVRLVEEEEASTPSERPAVLVRSRRLEMALGIACSILAAATLWLSLVRLPRAEREGVALREQVADITRARAPTLHVLEWPRRGSEETQRVFVRAGDQHVLLGLAARWGEEPPNRVHARLVAEDGAVISRWHLQRDELVRSHRASGVLTLMVVAGRVPDGNYRLRVDGSGWRSEIPIVVERVDPDAATGRLPSPVATKPPQ